MIYSKTSFAFTNALPKRTRDVRISSFVVRLSRRVKKTLSFLKGEKSIYRA